MCAKGFYADSGNTRCLSSNWARCYATLWKLLFFFFHRSFVCGHCSCAAILLQDSIWIFGNWVVCASVRCQALVGGDSLELFDVDLGERQWILKPEGQVQAAIEVEWSNWPGKKDDKIYRCFFTDIHLDKPVHDKRVRHCYCTLMIYFCHNESKKNNNQNYGQVMAVDWNAAIVTWLISEVFHWSSNFYVDLYQKESFMGPKMMQDPAFIHPVLRQSQVAMDADFKCGIWSPKHVSRQDLTEPLLLDSFLENQWNKRGMIRCAWSCALSFA